MHKLAEHALDAALMTRLLGEPVRNMVASMSGGNNRAFRVETAQQTYFAKQYFSSDADTRDRLDNEWRFLTYAAAANIPLVPRPIASDAASHLAIYTFLEGERPTTITADMVAQVGEWIAALNRSRADDLAQSLPTASEACFSANDYLSLMQKRLKVLESASVIDVLKETFDATLATMKRHAEHYGAALRDGYAALGIAADADLPRSEQCLSPSDFGFHNSLVKPSGEVQLIDFEYAGWDDPAKMLCDFFLHPGMAVNPAWLPQFLTPLKPVDVATEKTLARAALLYPILGLRWCCIILNVMVPEWAARRQFADANWNLHAAQEQQLAKANAMLEALARNPFAQK